MPAAWTHPAQSRDALMLPILNHHWALEFHDPWNNTLTYLGAAVAWDGEAARWYPMAVRLLHQLMTELDPPEFVTELLILFHFFLRARGGRALG
jgi:hypothetical protein